MFGIALSPGGDWFGLGVGAGTGEARMVSEPGEERERLLDPVDRISEILFGLIMAVTIVGSLSIATAGHGDVRTIMAAALGCNLAWGLVDAVMYLVRTVTERTRNRALARRIAAAEAAKGRELIARMLPDALASIVTPDEIEAMRRNLLVRPPAERGVLGRRDFLEALGIFAMVVVATFPVVLPFVLTKDVAQAMRFSQGITLAMLFCAGFALGRHAGYARPLWTGILMAVFGAVLITVVKALGG
jgi:VIT1/CCC1 family predicted Fe2+/Mn2+ transporter